MIMDHDHVFVTKLDNFHNVFNNFYSEKEFGSFRMFAGKEYLFVNFFNFQKFRGYMFCGGDSYPSEENGIPYCETLASSKFVNLGKM